MSKITILFLVSLLLCSSMLAYAARPLPAQAQQYKDIVEAEESKRADEGCEGVPEEECLMRRTLEAHLDYIYTQKHKP